jgi:hypothetical protein
MVPIDKPVRRAMDVVRMPSRRSPATSQRSSYTAATNVLAG